MYCWILMMHQPIGLHQQRNMITNFIASIPCSLCNLVQCTLLLSVFTMHSMVINKPVHFIQWQLQLIPGHMRSLYTFIDYQIHNTYFLLSPKICNQFQNGLGIGSRFLKNCPKIRFSVPIPNPVLSPKLGEEKFAQQNIFLPDLRTSRLHHFHRSHLH